MCAFARCRLVFVARGGAWSPANHHHWPDAFKAAARTLLLTASSTAGSTGDSWACGSCAGRGERRAPASLAALPADVLLRILSLAAAPMSTWLL